MKKEIVYTDKYAIILNDEYIKKSYDWNNFELSDFSESMDVILAHLPLTDAPILEGVPLLPSLEHICKFCGVSTTQPDEECYRASKYKYTEEDLKLAMNYGYVQGDTGFQGVANLDDLLDLILRKIKKLSRPTHFECEMEITHEGNGTYSTDLMDIGVSNLVPINIPKTKTNSQGQVELVGKYLNL